MHGRDDSACSKPYRIGNCVHGGCSNRLTFGLRRSSNPLAAPAGLALSALSVRRQSQSTRHGGDYGTQLHTDADKYQGGMGGWSKTLAPLFIEFIGGIKEGDRVLDVGCGTGSLTFTIADTTKASTVIGIDPSVGYLEYARAHNKYQHVTFGIGDAQNLSYKDDCFDWCVSSLMIQFVSDAHTVAREMRRVTKKGGSVATCVWDNSGGMELSERFWDAAVAVDPGAKRSGDRRYGSAGALSELWTATGFTNVETRALVIPMEFSSFDDF